MMSSFAVRARSLLAALLAAMVLAGCASGENAGGGASAPPPAAASTGVALRVTRDFGRTVLREETPTPAPRETVMSLTAKNAKVETAYGGGFVNSIDGLASSYTGLGVKQDDWFYLVNGVQPSRGAGEYVLAPGDAVWWDYRSWEFAVAIPAVVGQYPHPFVDGMPTDVLVSADASEAGGRIWGAVRGAGGTAMRFAPLGPDTPRPGGRHAIVVGAVDSLMATPWLREALDEPGRSGVFLRPEGTGLAIMDGLGGAHKAPRDVGAVAATSGETPGTAVWIVTGGSTGAVGRASDLIAKRPEALAGHLGVAVDASGTVVPLPVDPEWRPETAATP